MFDKSKKTNEIRPANQKPQNKPGISAKKDAVTSPRDNTDSKQAKSEMQSEGGKN